MDVNDVLCKYVMFKELIDNDARDLLCSNQIYVCFAQICKGNYHL